jgi:hypothetical protein
MIALILTVTPAECRNDLTWCLCRREVAKDYNACMVKKHDDCEKRYEVGKKACLNDDKAVEEYYFREAAKHPESDG